MITYQLGKTENSIYCHECSHVIAFGELAYTVLEDGPKVVCVSCVMSDLVSSLKPAIRDVVNDEVWLAVSKNP